jgi:hypothetical protein
MRWLLVPGLTWIFVLTSAAAHSQAYVNPVGGEVLTLCDSRHAMTGLNVGGACFPPGHIMADQNGEATIVVFDSVVAPVSFTIGQDIDGDGLFFEILVHGCGQRTVQAGYDWDPTVNLVVFVHGPFMGNPILSACGVLYSGGTDGAILHS